MSETDYIIFIMTEPGSSIGTLTAEGLLETNSQWFILRVLLFVK